jgi:hypothetical protein
MRNRRVVSDPLTKTPLKFRTRSPPPAFNAAEDVQDLPPSSEFSITMSARHVEKFSPEHPNSQTLYRRIIYNVRQFHALAVIILTDLHCLFAKHPFHTIYFFSKETTTDILHSLFRFCHDIWYGGHKECNIPTINNLRTKANLLARQLIEIVLWWYSAWRWRLELEGNISLLNTIWSKLTVLTGKGSGDIRWQAEKGSYWPFKSRDKAFAFLELEFSSPLWRNEPFSDYADFFEPRSVLARQLSQDVLDEYIESRKRVYMKSRKMDYPPKMPEFMLRRILRCYNAEEDKEYLLSFPAEYYGNTLRLGFVDDDGEAEWFDMTVGAGNLGPTGWKQVVSETGDDMLTGIGIGMLTETSHMVLVVPGGPLVLVKDFEDETGDNDLIPYTLAMIFNGVAEIGSEFSFEKTLKDENYVLKNFKKRK